MGKVVFITGGARSGKSAHAEAMASRYESVCYIATAVAFDDEMRARIEKHRAQRPAHWRTVESYRGLGALLAECAEQATLIDCLTIAITNWMLESPHENIDSLTVSEIDAMESVALEEIRELLAAAKRSKCDVFIVSNELGMGLVPSNVFGRAFRDIAGRANALVASEADEAYFLVSGIPVRLK